MLLGGGGRGVQVKDRIMLASKLAREGHKQG